jgi:hypothetical protein
VQLKVNDAIQVSPLENFAKLLHKCRRRLWQSLSGATRVRLNGQHGDWQKSQLHF